MGPSLSLDLTVDDLIAYNVHVLARSKANAKQLRLLRLLLLPVLVMVLLLVPFAAVSRDPYGLVLFTAMAVAFLAIIIFLPRYVASTIPAIDRIDETPDHVFVIVGPGQALIIPRRVGESVVQAFLQALHWYRGQLYADPAGHPPYGPNAWSA